MSEKSELFKAWLQQTTADLEQAIEANPSRNDSDVKNLLAALNLALACTNAAPVADVVAWHKEGEERRCDIRWRRFDVDPGPLFAVPQASAAPVEVALSATLPGGFSIDDAREPLDNLVQSHISKAISPEKMPASERTADLSWIHGVIVQAAHFVRASIEGCKTVPDTAAEPDDLSDEWVDMQLLQLAANKQREWFELNNNGPRLHTKDLVEADSELVAWQFKAVNGCWINVSEHGKRQAADDGYDVRALYTAPQSAPERNQVRREHAEWADITFGNIGPVGPLKHLSQEALEAAAEPGDLSEWADMQFLLWDAQRRAGYTDEQITQAMIEKLAINKQRQWPEPKDGEPRLHIKEQPAAMKDHQIRELVNELRDIAIKYHNTQQLREHLARAVRTAITAGGGVL